MRDLKPFQDEVVNRQAAVDKIADDMVKLMRS